MNKKKIIIFVFHGFNGVILIFDWIIDVWTLKNKKTKAPVAGPDAKYHVQ